MKFRTLLWRQHLFTNMEPIFYFLTIYFDIDMTIIRSSLKSIKISLITDKILKTFLIIFTLKTLHTSNRICKNEKKKTEKKRENENNQENLFSFSFFLYQKSSFVEL